jgi:hypothetical protein
MSYHPPPLRKDECLAVIQKALALVPEGGTINRVAICAQFPEITQSTIWRWIKSLEDKMPSRREINAAARALQERAEAGVTEHLPAVPPPAALARDGGAGIRRIDFAAEIPRLYADAEMLRAFSVKEIEDETGQPVEKIKNPVAFEK